jgi:Tol biopolymer transport system component/DNA-binding winged helix-turn-helix (wHTH) protein
MSVLTRNRVRFGPFELDPKSGELFRLGRKRKLQGHPIQILAMLLERPGELITREEIQQKLWPTENETFVDFEHGLNTAVRKLRQALADEAETPQYIETLPRRGYRFVGEISKETLTQTNKSDDTQVSAQDRGADPSTGSGQTSGRVWFSYRALAAAFGLALLLATGLYVLRFVPREPQSLVVTGSRQLTHSGALGLITGTSEQYGSVQTDGRRVYYTAVGESALRFVSVNGGEESALPSPIPNPIILHISPDGSTLIVRQVLGSKGRSEAPLWLVETNGGAARKLGDIEAQDAAFAPDGKTIVLAIDQALYLTDAKGAKPVKLADVVGRAFWLRWSSDGERLRFSTEDKDAIAAQLWELDRRGNLKQLLKEWKDAGQTCCGICCGVWTRDGKYFLFRSMLQYWAVRDSAKIERAEPKLLTTSGLKVVAATTSPLTNTVFVGANLERRDSMKLDLRTRQTSSVDTALKPQFVEYTADGQWMAYLHMSTTTMELWRSRVDGSERRQLTPVPLWVYMARFSPDGRKIAFMACWPDGPWKIFWVSVEGGALHEVPGGAANQADPNWSPDGRSILFGQPPESWVEPGVSRHLYIYDTVTGKTTEIEESTGLFSPRWSSDGRYVAAMRVDFQGISLLDRTAGKWQPLTHQPTDEPFWSSDSAWVYFNDFSDTAIWRVSARDGRLEQVMRTPVPAGYNFCHARAFAPDGQILLNCVDKHGDVYALDWK